MKTINISILAHVDAGKTSLTEALFKYARNKKTLGSVDEGTSITDTDDLEIERGISIYTSTTSFTHKDMKINILDTPGHMDFVHEVEQALLVSDFAILLVAANDLTLNNQSKKAYETLQAMKIPTLIFVNKIDIYDNNFKEIMNQIRVMTDYKAELLENSTSIKDILMIQDQKYMDIVEKGIESERDYKLSLKTCTNNLTFIPVLKGSAKTLLHVDKILDTLEELVSINEADETFSALVYKRVYHNKTLKTYVRIYSGGLSLNDSLLVNGENVIIRNLECLKNGKIVKTDYVGVNDIAILSLSDCLKIGEWMGRKDPSKPLLPWTKGQYLCALNYEAGSRIKVLEALERLIKVDPFVTYEINTVNNEISLVLVGEIKKQVIEHSLKKDYGLSVSLGAISIINKITPLTTIVDTVLMNTVENSHWATMRFRLDPLPLNSGFQYESLVNTGYLRLSFQNAIEEKLNQLLLTPYDGMLLTDFKITLEYAEFASPVSTPSDFRFSTEILFNKIIDQVKFQILEPLGFFELRVPETSLKKAYQDLNLKEAVIKNVEVDTISICISGLIPFKNVLNYNQDVLNYTNGSGSFSIVFHSCQKGPILNE